MPAFTPPADVSSQDIAAVADPIPSGAAEVAATRRRPLGLRAPIAALLVVALAVGGFFVWRAVADTQEKLALERIAQEQTALWKSSVDQAAAAPGVTVTDDKTITFQSESKPDCDADDYKKYDYWLGETTDWDALKRCRDTADLKFAVSATAALDTVGAFADSVGIPPSFKTRLGTVRGLDGTQELDFADCRTGPLHVTYSYDGGNGLFVQIQRSN